MVKLKNVSFYKNSVEKQISKNVTFKEPEGMIEVELGEAHGSTIFRDEDKNLKTCKWKCLKLLFIIGALFVTICCILMALCITTDLLTIWPHYVHSNFNSKHHQNNTCNNSSVAHTSDSDGFIAISYAELHYKNKRNVPSFYNESSKNQLQGDLSTLEKKEEESLGRNFMTEQYYAPGYLDFKSDLNKSATSKESDSAFNSEMSNRNRKFTFSNALHTSWNKSKSEVSKETPLAANTALYYMEEETIITEDTNTISPTTFFTTSEIDSRNFPKEARAVYTTQTLPSTSESDESRFAASQRFKNIEVSSETSITKDQLDLSTTYFSSIDDITSKTDRSLNNYEDESTLFLPNGPESETTLPYLITKVSTPSSFSSELVPEHVMKKETESANRGNNEDQSSVEISTKSIQNTYLNELPSKNSTVLTNHTEGSYAYKEETTTATKISQDSSSKSNSVKQHDSSTVTSTTILDNNYYYDTNNKFTTSIDNSDNGATTIKDTNKISTLFSAIDKVRMHVPNKLEGDGHSLFTNNAVSTTSNKPDNYANTFSTDESIRINYNASVNTTVTNFNQSNSNKSIDPIDNNNRHNQSKFHQNDDYSKNTLDFHSILDDHGTDLTTTPRSYNAISKAVEINTNEYSNTLNPFNDDLSQTTYSSSTYPSSDNDKVVSTEHYTIETLTSEMNTTQDEMDLKTTTTSQIADEISSELNSQRSYQNIAEYSGNNIVQTTYLTSKIITTDLIKVSTAAVNIYQDDTDLTTTSNLYQLTNEFSSESSSRKYNDASGNTLDPFEYNDIKTTTSKHRNLETSTTKPDSSNFSNLLEEFFDSFLDLSPFPFTSHNEHKNLHNQIGDFFRTDNNSQQSRKEDVKIDKPNSSCSSNPKSSSSLAGTDTFKSATTATPQESNAASDVIFQNARNDLSDIENNLDSTIINTFPTMRSKEFKTSAVFNVQIPQFKTTDNINFQNNNRYSSNTENYLNPTTADIFKSTTVNPQEDESTPDVTFQNSQFNNINNQNINSDSFKTGNYLKPTDNAFKSSAVNPEEVESTTDFSFQHLQYNAGNNDMDNFPDMENYLDSSIVNINTYSTTKPKEFETTSFDFRNSQLKTTDNVNSQNINTDFAKTDNYLNPTDADTVKLSTVNPKAVEPTADFSFQNHLYNAKNDVDDFSNINQYLDSIDSSSNTFPTMKPTQSETTVALDHQNLQFKTTDNKNGQNSNIDSSNTENYLNPTDADMVKLSTVNPKTVESTADFSFQNHLHNAKDDVDDSSNVNKYLGSIDSNSNTFPTMKPKKSETTVPLDSQNSQLRTTDNRSGQNINIASSNTENYLNPTDADMVKFSTVSPKAVEPTADFSFQYHLYNAKNDVDDFANINKYLDSIDSNSNTFPTMKIKKSETSVPLDSQNSQLRTTDNRSGQNINIASSNTENYLNPTDADMVKFSTVNSKAVEPTADFSFQTHLYNAKNDVDDFSNINKYLDSIDSNSNTFPTMKPKESERTVAFDSQNPQLKTIDYKNGQNINTDSSKTESYSPADADMVKFSTVNPKERLSTAVLSFQNNFLNSKHIGNIFFSENHLGAVDILDMNKSPTAEFNFIEFETTTAFNSKTTDNMIGQNIDSSTIHPKEIESDVEVENDVNDSFDLENYSSDINMHKSSMTKFKKVETTTALKFQNPNLFGITTSNPIDLILNTNANFQDHRFNSKNNIADFLDNVNSSKTEKYSHSTDRNIVKSSTVHPKEIESTTNFHFQGNMFNAGNDTDGPSAFENHLSTKFKTAAALDLQNSNIFQFILNTTDHKATTGTNSEDRLFDARNNIDGISDSENYIDLSIESPFANLKKSEAPTVNSFSAVQDINHQDLSTTVNVLSQSRLDEEFENGQLYKTFSNNTRNNKVIDEMNMSLPLNVRYSDQYVNNYENGKTAPKELSAVSQHLPRSQQTSISQNYGNTLCPTYVPSMGFPIVQQANTSPYVYSSSQGLPYTNMMPLPVPRIQTNSNAFVTSQFPYASTNAASNGYVLYNANGQNIIAPSAGGQYYICNPISNMVGSIHKDEDDSSKTDAHTSTEEPDVESSYVSEVLNNKTRASSNCPFTERKCEDDSKCIRLQQFCDGDVHCKDASDEAFCPCRFRIGKARICDGYNDCPNGEDELKCFGCGTDMFSCDDWSRRDNEATCIPLEQRCDGISQCPTGKDEHDCSILTEKFSERQHFMVSTTAGFLYRNFKGRWYPVCRNPELWANAVCKSEAGPSTTSPLTHLVPIKTNYHGPYVSASTKEVAKIVQRCESEAAVFVECPPLVCGMRKKLRNPYRRNEVDTSAEQILSQFLKTEDTSNEKNTSDSILGNLRVVGGNPSQPEAWPWIVSMYRNGVFHCGGALINDLWVITAAHCVDKYWHYYYEIQAGILRRYSYAPMVQIRTVLHVVSHQLYDRAKLKNDLALMKTSKPFVYNQYVRPICLPSEITGGKNFMWGPQPGTLCTAVGWGATVEHGTDPDHLREVEVPILKHCKHREDQEGHEICAGFMDGGKDACQGDSGGPFMCRNPNSPNQWYLVGIVSHGEGCARPNEPGVYTRVSLFLNWIFENIRAEVFPQRQPLQQCPGYICRKTKKCLASKRRCDRVVDCLLGDDELECDKSTFNEIFKHAMRHMFMGYERKNAQENDTVSAFVIEASDDNTEIIEVSTEEAIINTTAHENQTKRFLCKRMLQAIDFSKRCDGNVDCEDATDEENCLCAVYLKNTHPEAVCDGVSDCVDSSDEDNCGTCKEDQYYCRLSKKCISNEKRCNNIPDCDFEEDESDCFILTNGKTVELDDDSRPYLNSSGFVSFLYGNTWRVVCGNWTDNAALLAADICSYLGFSDYKSFYKISRNSNGLQIIHKKKVIAESNTSFSGDQCWALLLQCSEAIDITNRSENKTTFDTLPWNAEIYIDGNLECTGTVLNAEWVITSSKCFKYSFRLYENYVAVLLGRRKTDLKIVSPHEQVIQVIETERVADSDITLLRLKQNITFSRYIRPIELNVRDYAISERETCIATGRNLKNQTASVPLQVSLNCTTGSKCFKRIHPTERFCQEVLSNSWIGSIVCQSSDGWYPAAVYQDSKGFCGFNTVTAYTSVQYWKTTIAKLMKQTPYIVDPPSCGGVRCSLGQCIERNKVCDGMPDCRDAADEDAIYCRDLKEECSVLSNCACLKSELKCRNGKCVPKTAFCDRINDCGDWSDEPDYCTCGSYLNLTNPEKLCDGIRNCYDRTDEDPELCSCKSYHYRCGKTNQCVAPDMICDGYKDCPDGEDEAQCFALVSSLTHPIAEVQVRTGGLWHPGCFPKVLSTLKLEEICMKLGYIGGSAVRLSPNTEFTRKNTWRPVTDPFIGILINQNEKMNLILAIRSGAKPFVTLKPDPNCYRLYLKCL